MNSATAVIAGLIILTALILFTALAIMGAAQCPQGEVRISQEGISGCITPQDAERFIK